MRLFRYAPRWQDVNGGSPLDPEQVAHLEQRDLQLEDHVNPDAWHYVGASGEPAFQNSWVNGLGSNTPARFRMEWSDVVRIEGLVKSGGLNTIFTLPSAFWPALHQWFACAANDLGGPKIGLFVVQNDGQVICQSTGVNTFFGISCTFSLAV